MVSAVSRVRDCSGKPTALCRPTRVGRGGDLQRDPGPQATPILWSESEFIELKNVPEMIGKFACFQSILKNGLIRVHTNTGSDKFICYYYVALPLNPFKSCFIFLENNIKSSAN